MTISMNMLGMAIPATAAGDWLMLLLDASVTGLAVLIRAGVVTLAPPLLSGFRDLSATEFSRSYASRLTRAVRRRTDTTAAPRRRRGRRTRSNRAS